MSSGARARFVAAYSKLIADVWSDPACEAQLVAAPAAFLKAYDIVGPENCSVEVVRNPHDSAPDLNIQIRAWEASFETGTLILYVPELDPFTEVELSEHELDDLVGGLSSTCACCCPCCCTPA
jgi:natural product precursor